MNVEKEFLLSVRSYCISAYLRRMEQKDLVLHTLVEMVAESAQPTLYQFIPRELILRLPLDWSTIFTCLTALGEEGAVQLFHADTVTFSITQKGLDMAKSLSGEKGASHSKAN